MARFPRVFDICTFRLGEHHCVPKKIGISPKKPTLSNL